MCSGWFMVELAREVIVSEVEASDASLDIRRIVPGAGARRSDVGATLLVSKRGGAFARWGAEVERSHRGRSAPALKCDQAPRDASEEGERRGCAAGWVRLVSVGATR